MDEDYLDDMLGNYEDDPDEEDLLGGLSTATEVTPDYGQGGLAGELGDVNATRERIMARSKQRGEQLRSMYAPQEELWNRLAEELRTRRAGPSKSEQWMEIAAALAAPTNQRGIGGTMRNVMPVIKDQMTARRTGEEQNQSLIQKYMMDRAKFTTEKQKALLGNQDQTDQLLLRSDIAQQQARARAQAQQSALVQVRDANGNSMYIPRAQYEQMLAQYAPPIPGAAPQAGAAPQGGAEPPTVGTEADYAALPVGTVYRAPDGKLRRKGQ